MTGEPISTEQLQEWKDGLEAARFLEEWDYEPGHSEEEWAEYRRAANRQQEATDFPPYYEPEHDRLLLALLSELIERRAES